MVVRVSRSHNARHNTLMSLAQKDSFAETNDIGGLAYELVDDPRYLELDRKSISARNNNYGDDRSLSDAQRQVA